MLTMMSLMKQIKVYLLHVFEHRIWLLVFFTIKSFSNEPLWLKLECVHLITYNVVIYNISYIFLLYILYSEKLAKKRLPKEAFFIK